MTRYEIWSSVTLRRTTAALKRGCVLGRRPPATGRIDYTAFERTRIAGRERRRAEHALRTFTEIAEAAGAVEAVETVEGVEIAGAVGAVGAVEGAGAAETAETVEIAGTAPPDAARP